MSTGLFAEIRAAAAEVSRRARHVRIEEAALDPLAAEYAASHEAPSLDPAHHDRGDAASTLAFTVTLDAVNFGSGWFPTLAKRPGQSGYLTLAGHLVDRFEREGPLSPEWLRGCDAGACAALFGQDPANAPAMELMALFARAWRDLGEWLARRMDDRFEAITRAADGSAARLVALLDEMPLYRDVSSYEELRIPFYKRAQLTASDLAEAFGGTGPGRFQDLDELTIFADNLVPHVLRHEGVLVHDPELARRIDAGCLLEPGSPGEVEIRAVGLHAVELLVARLREQGVSATAHRLDHWLWSRGQSPRVKATPRHRARCPYY